MQSKPITSLMCVLKAFVPHCDSQGHPFVPKPEVFVLNQKLQLRPQTFLKQIHDLIISTTGCEYYTFSLRIRNTSKIVPISFTSLDELNTYLKKRTPEEMKDDPDARENLGTPRGLYVVLWTHIQKPSGDGAGLGGPLWGHISSDPSTASPFLHSPQGDEKSYSTSGSVSLRSSHSVTSVSGSVSVSSSVGKRVRDTSTSKTSGGRKKHQQQSDYFVKFSNVPHLQPWLFHHTCTVLHLLCHVESALGSDTKWTLLHFGKKLENDGRPLKEWLTRRSDGLFPVVVISEDSDPRILQSATATDPDDASHCSSLKNSFDRGCRIQDVASLGAAGACEMAYPPIAMVGPTTFESVAIQPHPHPHVMMAGHTPFFHASDALGTPFATMEISASDDASAVYGEIPLTSQADMSTTTEPWAGGLEDLISDINVAAAAAGYYAVAGAGTGLGASFLETEMTILRTLWINAPHDAFTFPPEAKIEGDTVRRWHQKLLMPERRKYLGDVFGGANETMVKKLVHDRLAEDDDRSVHRAQRLLLQLCVERLAKVRAMDEGVGKAKKAFALKCMWAQYLSIQRVIDADHVMKCVADSNDDDFN